MKTLTLEKAHEKIKEIALSTGGDALIAMTNKNGERLVDMVLPADKIGQQSTMLSLLENAVMTVCAELVKSGMSYDHAESMIKLCTIIGLTKADEAAGYRHEN